jgi:glycosyltransferase involved in cell wall biosynthesis
MKKKVIQFAIQSSVPSGGSLKVKHYFEHSLGLETLETKLYMPPETEWSTENLWYPHKAKVIPRIEWGEVDIAFISGWGWERFIPKKYHENPPFTIIYLIQSFDKLDPQSRRYKFLFKPAIHVCVSDPLKKRLQNIDHVNGDIRLIAAGTDLVDFPIMESRLKSIDVLIVGNKNVELGQELEKRFKSYNKKSVFLSKTINREMFINYLLRARITILLPQKTEGFYLPAIEAMAAGSLVICPYVLGNDFCIDGYNCLVPDYNIQSIISCLDKALVFSSDKFQEMLHKARKTSLENNLKKERKSFHSLINEILGWTENKKRRKEEL